MQSSGSQTNYSLDITPTIRYSNYIDPDTWFWFAEGSGDYSFTQNNYDSICCTRKVLQLFLS